VTARHVPMKSTRDYRSVTALILVVTVCLYGGGFGLLAARAYDAHETGGAFDLGNYTQALWNAARGEGLSLTTAPEFGPTRFAMHVEPTLFVLAPVFGLAGADPRLLLWFQAIVIALGGLPLYGLTRRRLACDPAALGIVLAYFLLPALESVTLFDFHAVGLAPTLLLTGMYFLDRALVTPEDPRGLWSSHPAHSVRDCRPLGAQPPASAAPGGRGANRLPWAGLLSGLFLLLALGTKEDVPLSVCLLGLYLLLWRRRWRPGLALCMVSAVWFYVAVFQVIPAARPDGSHSAYLEFFAPLGSTPLEILLSPLRTPDRVLAVLATPDALRGVCMLSLPLALTPLAGLPFLLMAAPALAISLFSANPMMHKLETYHYAAPVLPFVAVAAVDGTARLAGWLARAVPRATRQQLVLGVVGGIVLASFIYHYYRGYSPLARPFHWPEVSAHNRLGTSLAASIPPAAPVVAQAELVPLLANRPYVRVWTGPFDERAEYYLLDVSHPAFTNRDGAQARLVADIAYEPSVGMIASQDGFLLLQRDAPRVAITPEFFTFMLGSPPAHARSADATFGDTLQLVAYETGRLPTDREAEPLLTMYWRVLHDPPEDYLIAVFLLDADDNPVGVTLVQQPATVWWPTGRWETGDMVRVLANTFPWWSGDRSEFGYGVAVVQGQDPWQIAARLPVVRADGKLPPIDAGTVLPLVSFTRVAGIPYAD
jgi:uncharacterized membrane protein